MEVFRTQYLKPLKNTFFEFEKYTSDRKFSVEKNRQTNARNKWIRKENWLVQFGEKLALECNLPPKSKCKMVMPVQNYNFVCSCIRIKEIYIRTM